MFRPSSGWIEVICGPMFSGKSEELIRRVTRSRIARLPVQTFKPALDVRFAEAQVVSHSRSPLRPPGFRFDEFLRAVADATVVVGIDEGHSSMKGWWRLQRSWPQRQAGHRCRTRHRLPSPTFRAHPDLVGGPNSSRRCWPCATVRRARPFHTANRSLGRPCRARCPGRLRGPLSGCYSLDEAEQPSLALTRVRVDSQGQKPGFRGQMGFLADL